MDPLARTLVLPCGAVLPNRLCKAAMTEGLADRYNRATPELERLYAAWSDGGTGLLITGNIQVDRRYVERPGNVVIDGPQDACQLAALRAFAKAATRNGTHCWAQLGHAGRQCDIMVSKQGVGPSALASNNLAGYGPLLMRPTWPPEEMSVQELTDLTAKFAAAAQVCKEVGFTGVQIHSAHGYLLSSFLNPNCNKREDKYGGSAEKRSLLVLETYRAVRDAVGPAFPIGVKLNSSDFQKGGFTLEGAMDVAAMLDEVGVDLLEISGGNYENPVLLGGENVLNSTFVREAYFLKYADGIKERMKHTPLMVTGGFRSRACMEGALEEGSCAVIGIGRPLAGMPDASNKILRREIDTFPQYENDLDLPRALRWMKQFQLGKIVRTFMIQTWYYRMMILVSQGEKLQLPSGQLYGPMSCALFMEAWDKRQAASLLGLKTQGTVVNAGVIGRSVNAALVMTLSAMSFVADRLAGRRYVPHSIS